MNSSTVRSAKRVSPLRMSEPLARLCASMWRAFSRHTVSRCRDSSQGGAEPGQYSESLPWRVAQARKSAECAGAPEGAGCLGVTRGTAFEMDVRAPAGTLRGREARKSAAAPETNAARVAATSRARLDFVAPARPDVPRRPEDQIVEGGIVARGRGLVARGRQGRARGCVSRHRPRLAPSARRRSLWRPRGEASQSTHLRYSTRGVTDWRASWHIATVREP